MTTTSTFVKVRLMSVNKTSLNHHQHAKEIVVCGLYNDRGNEQPRGRTLCCWLDWENGKENTTNCFQLKYGELCFNDRKLMENCPYNVMQGECAPRNMEIPSTCHRDISCSCSCYSSSYSSCLNNTPTSSSFQTTPFSKLITVLVLVSVACFVQLDPLAFFFFFCFPLPPPPR